MNSELLHFCLSLWFVCSVINLTFLFYNWMHEWDEQTNLTKLGHFVLFVGLAPIVTFIALKYLYR